MDETYWQHSDPRSTVLAATPEFVEWWTHYLHPNVHYAAVAEDWRDVVETMTDLRANPRRAGGIAAKGQELALQLLSVETVDCFWWVLFAEMGVVVPTVGALPRRAKPLEDVLLWPPDAALTDRGGRGTLTVPLNTSLTRVISKFAHGQAWRRSSCEAPHQSKHLVWTATTKSTETDTPRDTTTTKTRTPTRVHTQRDKELSL